MSKPKLYTIDIDTPEEMLEMMNSTTSDELRIINFRFEFDYTGVFPDDYYKVIYVTIGSSTSSNYFIDNNVGFYSCPLMCDNGYVDPVSFRSVTFASGVSIPYTASNPLDHSFTVKLYDKDKQLIDANILKHCFIQFEYV